MDKNEFIHKTALSICSSLDIEKSLLTSLIILQEVMPVTWMAVEHYDAETKAMRTIAITDTAQGKSVDLLTPLSDDAQNQASQKLDTGAQKVFLFTEPQKEKLAKEMLDFHGVKASSLIVLPLESGKKRIGTVAVVSEGKEKFTEDHADILANLSGPFAIALSNTLKHRNELKLFDRDFFWEVTMRICGNMEIEQAMCDSIYIIKKLIPVDRMFLQIYEPSLSAMRTLATATPEKGENLDLLTPLPQAAREKVRKNLTANLNGAVIIDSPQKNPVAKEMLRFHGIEGWSVMRMTLITEAGKLGGVVLTAKGPNQYLEKHARLLSLLKEPFTIALSNTLGHREIIKLKDLLADDNRFLHGELRRLSGDEIIGANFGLKDVMFKVKQVASLDSPVLLLGETGVGKDVIANAIHYSSSRNAGPFVSVNCGAIPDTLIDSELFGHEKGAFTGALVQKRGRFERANGGTIFLDEIGELSLQAQVRLLKVLQSKEIERVGGVKTISLDIRIIAATNRNLEEMVRENQFREDLWFRLNVFPIWIPPLRDRSADIPALLQHFISQKAKELKLPAIPSVSPGTTDMLMDYHWPGNVRELQNIVERELILNPSGPLTFDHMNQQAVNKSTESSKKTNITDNLDEVTSKHIRNVLNRTNGKIHGPGGAAEFLGINANTLRNRMIKLGINFGKSKSR